MKAPLSFTSAALASALLSGPALAGGGGDLDFGNGLGNAYITSSPMMLGGKLVIDMGSPGLAFGNVILSVSDGAGPTVSFFPGIGEVCLDVFSPAYAIYGFTLDGTGNLHLEFDIPNVPGLAGAPPFYANALTVEPPILPQFSISKTVRIHFENSDSYSPVAPMSASRAFHTTTPLGEGPLDNQTRLLVAGGGDGNFIVPFPRISTELYNPITRGFQPGPNMSQARMAHTAVRLPDGKVLIVGGTGNGGVVTASCDLYDPATNTISPTGAMTTPRTGHAMTLLPNGRVLVTGGLSTYVNAATQFASVLNSAQDTAELYDFTTGTWTAIASPMGSDRSGHRQVLLADGTVLVIAGMSGGQVGQFGGEYPVFTGSVDLFDSNTNSFTAAPPMEFENPFTGPTEVGRAFFGASLLGNGNVLVSGGAIDGGPTIGATASSEVLVFDGSSWITPAQGLPLAVAFHSQVTGADGDAIILGGFTSSFSSLFATGQAGRHDGMTYTETALVGTNPGFPSAPVGGGGNQTLTPLFDGTYLLLGGASGTDTHAGGYVFIE